MDEITGLFDVPAAQWTEAIPAYDGPKSEDIAWQPPDWSNGCDTFLYGEAKEIIEKWNMTLTNDVMAKVRKLLWLEKMHGDRRNNRIFEDRLPECWTGYPSAQIHVKTLMGSYKRIMLIGDNHSGSSQEAKPFEDLVKRGAVAQGNPNSTHRTFKTPKGKARMILYCVNKPNLIVAGTMSKKRREALLRGKTCVLSGSPRKLKMDHRMPTKIRDRFILNEPSPQLDEKLVANGKLWDVFQPLCEGENCSKREQCDKCYDGYSEELGRSTHEIELPLFIKASRAYKTFFNEDGKLCDGCYYAGPDKPMRPENLPDGMLDSMIKMAYGEQRKDDILFSIQDNLLPKSQDNVEPIDATNGSGRPPSESPLPLAFVLRYGDAPPSSAYVELSPHPWG